MVDAAVRDAINEDRTILLEWKRIYNQVNRQRKFRNKLAHFKIVFDASDLENQQYCLVLHILKSMRMLTQSIIGQTYSYLTKNL